MKFRAFISTDFEPNDKLVSAIRELERARADLKVVKPDLLHLTLKFLGDTEESLVNEIMDGIVTSTDGVEPFNIGLKGMGAFPSMSNVRVVWVGIDDGRPLVEIAKKLDVLLQDLGFERDKKGFVPHLTLARARSGRNIANIQEILRNNPVTDFGRYKVDRILLKKSVLSPHGPSYSTVGEHLLAQK